MRWALHGQVTLAVFAVKCVSLLLIVFDHSEPSCLYEASAPGIHIFVFFNLFAPVTSLGGSHRDISYGLGLGQEKHSNVGRPSGRTLIVLLVDTWWVETWERSVQREEHTQVHIMK